MENKEQREWIAYLKMRIGGSDEYRRQKHMRRQEVIRRIRKDFEATKRIA